MLRLFGGGEGNVPPKKEFHAMRKQENENLD